MRSSEGSSTFPPSPGLSSSSISSNSSSSADSSRSISRRAFSSSAFSSGRLSCPPVTCSRDSSSTLSSSEPGVGDSSSTTSVSSIICSSSIFPGGWISSTPSAAANSTSSRPSIDGSPSSLDGASSAKGSSVPSAAFSWALRGVALVFRRSLTSGKISSAFRGLVITPSAPTLSRSDFSMSSKIPARSTKGVLLSSEFSFTILHSSKPSLFGIVTSAITKSGL